MKTFHFFRQSEDDVIIVSASIEGKYKFRLALDTAATHTTIDSNVLYFSGYNLKDGKGEQEVETASGIIVVESFEVDMLECLGITRDRFLVQVYDFLAHGVTSDYDGVVGLDFLKNCKFCVDVAAGEITMDV